MAIFSPELLESWKRGVDEFNRGAYWEAHHHWERDWTRLPSPDRQRVQAYIAACGCLVHLSKSKAGPALSLCRLAIARLAEIDAAATERSIGPRLEIAGIREALFEAERALAAELGEARAAQGVGPRQVDPRKLAEIRSRLELLKGELCHT